jgi:hypothetical protein
MSLPIYAHTVQVFALAFAVVSVTSVPAIPLVLDLATVMLPGAELTLAIDFT